MKVTWEEESEKGDRWFKINPQVEVTYDPVHSYLLSVSLYAQKSHLRAGVSSDTLGLLFFSELKEANVLQLDPESILGRANE